MDSSDGWNVTDIKKKVAECHSRGAISDEVVRLVVRDGYCAPIESEIFDYKKTRDTTAQAVAKTVKQIVSFYNAYGGYLLFGVEETVGEKEFRVVGFPREGIDLESLKATIREYIGERIQIGGVDVAVVTDENVQTTLFLLFIPKRPDQGRPPVHFVRDAPGQIFFKDEVYYRLGDECAEAKGPKLFALTQPRPNPYLDNQASGLLSTRMQHNLPERNFICPRFVGREQYIEKLWRWLGDDLSHIRMLAGEGGLGKTSIAYEFGERLLLTPNVPFEQIVWLTAKRLQYVGYRDDYVPVPETHYSSYEELLRAVIRHLPLLISEEDLRDMGAEELRRRVKEGLSLYPTFLVVDDVDSLNTEQQRQVFELGFLFGSVQSKLLLTTRHNQSYSQDSATTIAGFDPPDFSRYLESLRERKILQRDLSSTEVKALHGLTGGSPLFTESVCRLLRFQSFGEAIKGWGQNAGARVRAAALDREIAMLSPEAKRVLLTAALYGEVSVPEIADITEYPHEVILSAIEDLSSLFLLAGETLGDQPQFSVPDNTIRLVLERATTLVTDHKRLKDRVLKRKTGQRGSHARDERVARAISQAQAQCKLRDVEGALRTIDDARRMLKNKADLLGFRAEVLMRFAPPKYDEARKDAREASQKNCRRPSMFEAWFEAEWQAGHFVGAEEVARAAIEKSMPGNSLWWARLAAALAGRADSQNVGAVVEKRVTTFFEASDALSRAIRTTRGNDGKEFEKNQFDIHDRVWQLIHGSLGDLNGIAVAVDALEKLAGLNDHRFTNANRAIVVCEAICSWLGSPAKAKSEGQINAAEMRFHTCEKLIADWQRRYPDDTRQPVLEKALNAVRTKFANALAKRRHN